ncbi:hypothetical protein WN51_09529 [Melipona quadrifasciata]|uniref:Uncharacterized protein n=1 Tax=Melipona quadrifasciata TaxID=166423 RepID=A0A0M9A6D7_9HYME|nr:hypothetical protein WN51_09529 [Melipona quadrifasciata]
MIRRMWNIKQGLRDAQCGMWNIAYARKGKIKTQSIARAMVNYETRTVTHRVCANVRRFANVSV